MNASFKLDIATKIQNTFVVKSMWLTKVTIDICMQAIYMLYAYKGWWCMVCMCSYSYDVVIILQLQSETLITIIVC